MTPGIAVWPVITHTDFWLIVALSLLVGFAIKACRFNFPDPQLLQAYATVANTKGGIIIILLFLWIFTLGITVSFCVWVIVRGIDPQHAVVIFMTGVLSGTAFGNVNGAFFKAMTGEDPRPPAGVSTSKTETATTAPAAPVTTIATEKTE